ncbi:MAG TPA: hypothetical protein RMH85_14680 [Polyangiaceae bacterium LLY-WYZ-15_(1-7)]|nr:hypothetical protein [Sandaracinus sp.]HJL02745.1 hypothetical protein [Polyangiaceae bacterium LLY-WYZ-15_(1-7)]MBJ73788.1 hypothetical protein [Sandaracinus sp.]HJL09745.1 hypothetical protein [Polyangiaceae bacterium LLY-WYZ-15_(1-7)]HJL39275.1 hypothetical protein [Polyangiaceae bacterium LLY-WYZ-15_(1-7)]
MRIDTKIGLVLALLGALACGDDGEGGGRVMMTVEVTEVSADEALEGAEICITSHDGYACATTDATGFTTMEAPANAEPVFRVTHPRTVPGLMPVTTTSVDGAFEAEVAEPGLTNILLNLVGITPDATKGNILVLAGGPMGMSGIGGVTYALSPADGEGPFYFDEGAMPDAELTSTSGSGAAAFANVEPGDYTFSFSGPYGCDWEIGHGQSATEATLPVVAGELTIISLEDCEELPD